MSQFDNDFECKPGGPAERLTCLHAVVEALSSAYSLEDVADVIITRGLSTLGGNAGSVALLNEDGTELNTIRCVGFPEWIVAKYQTYSADTDLPNSDVIRTGEPIFIETRDERNRVYPHLSGHDRATSSGARHARGALAAMPLIANGRPIGGLMLNFPTDRPFSVDDRTFMQIIADICAQALERARLNDAAQSEIAERRRMMEQQRMFLRDVLLSVTEGKLHLCHSESEMPARAKQVGEEVPLTRESGLDLLRHASFDAAITLHLPLERAQDLMTAASEAGMNAIIHAGGGSARVCSNGTDLIQVWITDTGKGIDVEDLPHATLMRGYSTAGTLGHGMKIMLETIDRLWLMTGHAGTTVALEQNLTAPAEDVDNFPHV